MTLFIGLLGVILGTLVGAVATYLTTRANTLLQIQHSHDQTLIEKRLERYQELFHISKCLPSYWLPGEEPHGNDLRQLRQDLTDWYFGESAGGMFLSLAAKQRFMSLLYAIVDIAYVKSQEWENFSLTLEQSQSLRQLASKLRHQLAEDVGASNPPKMQSTVLDTPTPVPASFQR
jgi:hypothetical protein